MEEQLTILSEPSIPESQDFQLLRQAGLGYIEALGHTFWTDYNLHDPGITILEALCYAITDLGYRTDFPVADLLTTVEGLPSQDLFSARTILHTCPLTVNDYRKLLVDLEGIHNAWFNTTVGDAEIPFYVDCAGKKLTYSTTERPIRLNGLYYKVLLEFSPNDDFGDLNDDNLLFWAQMSSGRFKLAVRFPNWNSLVRGFLNGADNPATLTGVSVNVFVKTAEKRWRASLRLTYLDNGGTKTLDLDNVVVNILEPGGSLLVDESVFMSELKSVLTSTDSNGLLHRYRQKMKVITELVDQVWARLHAHRNLCEDFLAVESIGVEDIGFCADVEIEPSADVEEVLAQIYFAIQNYFQPDLKFYSLKELIDQGKKTGDIFDGPRLDHGFLLTEDLERTELRKVIHVSDLINLIMDVEGVINLRDPMLSKYDSEGNVLVSNERWRLKISENHRPRLSLERSKVLFFKSELPFLARDKEMRDTLQMLHAAASRQKQRGGELDFPIPAGQLLDLDDYTSVQHEFPSFYGLGYNRLPDSIPVERKARVRQLKAYLLFFDQLLADYLAQLRHVGSLFSFHEDLKQTYFARFIDDFDDFEAVYAHASQLELATAGPGSAGGQIWTDLFEPPEIFLDRRNRFLDHLLARFGEQFSDYALMLFDVEGQKKGANELIEDKMKFLQDYPEISACRGRAFNYKAWREDENGLSVPDTWNTDNVAGLVKRLARLAGIHHYKRRSCCRVKMEIYGAFKFRILNKEDSSVLLSSRYNFSYDTEEEACRMVETAWRQAARAENYRTWETHTGFRFGIVDEQGERLAFRNVTYTRREVLEAAMLELQEMADQESLTLVEHILLRPKTTNDHLLSVCLENNCNPPCAEEDPYSFRLTIVLPYWPLRFNNLPFRAFFERTVHLETPAHIIPKICWVNEAQLRAFQDTYRAWLAEHAKPAYEQDANQLTATLNQLIETLEALRSVYPPAFLHDCDEGGTESNPVFLNQTSLGAENTTQNDTDNQ